MNHKEKFIKCVEKLNKVIIFLTENDLAFSLESDHYLDDEYFNFRNVFKIWKENENRELYLELNKNETALYVYANDYSARTGQQDEIIKGIKNIKNYLKK
ncbi:hypothetical protein ACEXAJ_01330 [Fusobacterium necrophorum subsp. funduliforme]